MNKIMAVCGWGIPPIWFEGLVKEHFPHSRITVIYPQYPEDAQEAKALLSEQKADLYIGYSLGSLWLLHHQAFLPLQAKVALLAPILAFIQEKNMGGKTSEVQFNFFLKLVKQGNTKEKPLGGFYSQCDISPTEQFLEEIPTRAALIRGLTFLKSVRYTHKLDNNFIAIVGSNDPFLDSIILKQYIPNLTVLPHAGHAPQNLLNELKNNLESRNSFQ